MITSVRMVNFKNFADETLRVGPFTIIVGANASGKSNIRDAFRFLHGIGRGYTLAEILGGKHGVGGQVEWEGIRGRPTKSFVLSMIPWIGRPSFPFKSNWTSVWTKRRPTQSRSGSTRPARTASICWMKSSERNQGQATRLKTSASPACLQPQERGIDG